MGNNVISVQFLKSCCVLRFCLSETSCPQEDNYPNGLCIKVNGKLFPLPVSTEPCRASTSEELHVN